MEAVKTNVIGSNNVIDACVENRVKRVVCLSTDKAAYPINAMGMSKALMEKNRHRPVKADAGGRPCALPDALRKRHGLPRLGHSAVLRPDRRGPSR